MNAQSPDSPAAASAPPRPAGRDRFLLAIVAGTILLVVVSILVVFLYGRARTAPSVDPNSPAGVVQAYVEATRNGEVEKARSYLTRQARAEVEARDRQNSYRPTIDDNVRIIIEPGTVTDTSAEVKVAISRFYARSDPFSSSNYHRDTTVRLVREDGAWRISQPLDAYAFS